MHLDWIFFIILLSAICWAYIKYIRPMVMNSIDGRQVLSRRLYRFYADYCFTLFVLLFACNLTVES